MNHHIPLFYNQTHLNRGRSHSIHTLVHNQTPAKWRPGLDTLLMCSVWSRLLDGNIGRPLCRRSRMLMSSCRRQMPQTSCWSGYTYVATSWSCVRSYLQQ
jgi:hypothetical protein